VCRLAQVRSADARPVHDSNARAIVRADRATYAYTNHRSNYAVAHAPTNRAADRCADHPRSNERTDPDADERADRDTDQRAVFRSNRCAYHQASDY
jgi:hypothetical protein